MRNRWLGARSAFCAVWSIRRRPRASGASMISGASGRREIFAGSCACERWLTSATNTGNRRVLFPQATPGRGRWNRLPRRESPTMAQCFGCRSLPPVLRPIPAPWERRLSFVACARPRANLFLGQLLYVGRQRESVQDTALRRAGDQRPGACSAQSDPILSPTRAAPSSKPSTIECR